jgi:hypothetical protein
MAYSKKNERLVFRANDIPQDAFAGKSLEEILSTPILTRRQGRTRGEFICGPIPLAWLTVAAQASAAAAYLGVLLWHLARMRGEPVVLSHSALTRYGFKPRQALRLLRQLAETCLIRLDIVPGKAPRVRIVPQSAASDREAGNHETL